MLLLAHSLQPGLGGIARVARLMARVLMEEFAPESGTLQGLTLGDSSAPSDIAFPIRPSGGSRFRFLWDAMRAARSSQRFVYDACHLAQLHRFPFFRNKPFLAFIHGIEIWEDAKPGYVRSAHRATMLLANSHFTREKAERIHGGFSRARVCWLATESDEAPAPHPPADGPPEVLIVGRLAEERYKGHRLLISDWARVNSAVPGAILRIVGSGPDLPALRDLASHSPAASQIVFEGFVPDAKVEACYARATAFAMPSRGEGFGLVYIEAMRHGLPIIASCHDAAPEVVLDGRTGYIVDQDQPGQVAERLIALLRDRDAARSTGEAGRQRWAEHFRFSSFRQRFRPLLREFLDS